MKKKDKKDKKKTDEKNKVDPTILEKHNASKNAKVIME
jgi:hypothetical protein